VKKTEATKVVGLFIKTGLAGQALKSTAQDRETATGTNRVVLRSRHKGVADGGGDEEAMADMHKEEEAVEEARHMIMAKAETATRTVTDTESETELEALATND
jgi:hypothetical protein